MADINGIMAQINGLRNSYGIPGQRTTSPFGNPLQPGQVPQMPAPLTLGRPMGQPAAQPAAPPPMAFGSMAPRPFNSGVPNPTPPTLGYPMPTPMNPRGQIAQANIARQASPAPSRPPVGMAKAMKMLYDAGVPLNQQPQGLIRGTPAYDAYYQDLFWKTFPNYTPGG